MKSILKSDSQLKPNDLTLVSQKFQQLYPESSTPEGEAATRQQAWDEIACKAKFNDLLNSASNQVHSARLLAAASPHSGAWLQALPSPSLGLYLDDDTVRISVALRLGSPISEPHKCKCGVLVTSLGHHALSCKLSSGRLPRHHQLNDTIKRSLDAAGIPSWLEPSGLDPGPWRW